VKEKKGGTEDYLYIADPKGLLTLVQMGTIEVHGWGSRVKPLEKPDRLVFDLDPDVGLDFADVRKAALRLKALLADLGLASFPMTTGGKGLHVIVPLDATVPWPKVSDFAERFARAIAEAEPQTFTANIRKVAREGRIFLDWLRNQRGATAVMTYSARARDGAPVAAPIAWEELDAVKGGNVFTILDADLLLERASSKLLAGWGEAKQKLPNA
jgi:bifunctional non-homologous end joining protein LigD